MRWAIRIAMCWGMLVCQHTLGEPTWPAQSPWRGEADELPALGHKLEVILEIEHRDIVTFEPVIARITLTNLDERPLRLKVRDDGAPRSVASLVRRGEEPFFRHHQWLRTSGPKGVDITVSPGESTTGEILILFGGPPTGLPFAEAERYWVKFACQADRHYAPAYTNEVEIRVTRDEGDNAAFLGEVSDLFYQHSGWEREWVVRNYGEDYVMGALLLKKIISQDSPYPAASEDDPTNVKAAQLVESLTKLFERHPESSYSAYVARFLGFAHLGSLDNKMKRETRARMHSQEPRTWDPAPLVGDPAYQNALRYLTIADQAELWNRTSALGHLAGLYGIAQEWDKVQRICDKLRTEYAELNGVALADELERGMEKRKRKIARWKKSQLPDEEE